MEVNYSRWVRGNLYEKGITMSGDETDDIPRDDLCSGSIAVDMTNGHRHGYDGTNFSDWDAE